MHIITMLFNKRGKLIIIHQSKCQTILTQKNRIKTSITTGNQKVPSCYRALLQLRQCPGASFIVIQNFSEKRMIA